MIERIPAKPTTYRGQVFRSRLEARWAYVFHAVGLEYQYEPCAFYLDPRRFPTPSSILCERGATDDVGGDVYLPDFYLPQLRSWVEVKGCDKHLDYRRMTWAALCMPETPAGQYDNGGLSLIILGPLPGPDRDGVFGFPVLCRNTARTVDLYWTDFGTERGRYGYGPILEDVAWRSPAGHYIHDLAFPLVPSSEKDFALHRRVQSLAEVMWVDNVRLRDACAAVAFHEFDDASAPPPRNAARVVDTVGRLP